MKKKESSPIRIKKGKTEITINEQAIFVSAPSISVTVMTGGKSASTTIVTKDGVDSQVHGSPLEKMKADSEDVLRQTFKISIDGKTLYEICSREAKEEMKKNGKSAFVL